MPKPQWVILGHTGKVFWVCQTVLGGVLDLKSHTGMYCENILGVWGDTGRSLRVLKPYWVILGCAGRSFWFLKSYRVIVGGALGL